MGFEMLEVKLKGNYRLYEICGPNQSQSSVGPKIFIVMCI